VLACPTRRKHSDHPARHLSRRWSVGFDEAMRWGRGRRDGRFRVENQHKHRIGGVGVDVPRRDWRLVAGVVVVLLALVVVGRLQGGKLPGGDAEAPRATSTTVTDAPPRLPRDWR
jgi:hypothetical protein